MSSERRSRQRRALLEGEQLLAASAAALQRRDDLARHRVDDRLDPPLAALGRVVEHHLAVARERDVALAHRREAVRGVLHRVLLRADPEEAAVEQADGAGEHARAVELVAVEIGARSGRAAAAAPGRSAPCRRTSPRRAARASAGGRGTACGRRRRRPSPAGARRRRSRSIRPSTPAGCPARGSARSRPRHRSGFRRGRDTRIPCRVRGGGFPVPSSRIGVYDSPLESSRCAED